MEAALIDVADPALIGTVTTANESLAERSRWPGSEARLALSRGNAEVSREIGIGGYFSPHETVSGRRFNAWAATIDYRSLLPWRMEWSGSLYRGQALGGLGGGTKDYVYTLKGTEYFLRPLDDAGGWTQMKKRIGEQLEFNAAFGMDNVFASELRPYAIASGSSYNYENFARNRTFFTNIIYAPSAYLLFSLEYRRIMTAPAIGPGESGNIFGIAAGYKF